MPASSQTSPTSTIRSTGSSHAAQRIGTASIHGLRSSSSCSSPESARSSSSRTRADDVQVPALAGVEGQRQPVEAAARDVPVAHVPQPVVHALAHVGGRPLDRRVRLEQRLAKLVDRDQPVVGHAPDQRRVAAPAVRDSGGGTSRPRADTPARRGDRRSGRPRRSSKGRGASRRSRRTARPRRPARAPAGRGLARARSPPGPRRARCGRCPSPPRARPRPRG